MEYGIGPSQPQTVGAGTNDLPSPLGCNELSPDAEPYLGELLKRVQNLEQYLVSSAIHGRSETGQNLLARQSGLQEPQVILNKTRTLRSSHWLGAADEVRPTSCPTRNVPLKICKFAPIVACYAETTGNSVGEASFQSAETKALINRIGVLLQKCKDTSRRIKVGRPHDHFSSPELSLTNLSREVADKMVAAYFQSFESTHRILHMPSFMKEYWVFWDHPDSVATDVRFKILLVIAIGSSLHENTDTGLRDMIYQWVHAAQTWLSGPLKKDRLEISGLQVYCLTIIARQVFCIGGDLVWMSMGSLVHRAMQMGLHRDPKHIPAMPVLRAELRRRLWATILEMVVQSSLDAAMPPRISFDEFDTEPPSNVDDNEFNESTTVLHPHPRGTFTETSLQLILLDSLPTRLRILQLLNGLHSELSYETVLALSSEISDANRTCSNFVKDNELYGVTAFSRNLLDYLVRRFLIPLHSSFAIKARKNPLFHYSLKVCLDTAMAIISPEPDDGFSRLMAIGGGMFREGIRYAITAISMELLAEVDAQLSERTLHRNHQYRDFLKQAVRDMITLSIERIRQGETNVKSHMFLSMVLVLAEAKEMGFAYEQKIAQAAVDSLEFCHGLLRDQLGTANLPTPTNTGLTPASLDGAQEVFGFDFDIDFFLSDTGFS